MFPSAENYREHTEIRGYICLNLSLALNDVSGCNFLFQIVDSNYNYKYFYLYSFHSLFKINRSETQHAKNLK